MKQFGVGTGNSQGTVDLVLLVLRVVAGLVFFMHGYQKLFDDDLSTTQTGFDGMGAPLPDITAVIVMFVELIGGLALILGVLTGIFAALHLIDMVSAFVIVHVENGFFVMNGGFELVFLLAGAATVLLLTGAGAFLVDAMLGLPGRAPLTPASRRA